MKKIIFVIGVLLISISCKAQIIPVEDFENYNNDIPDGAYIKDVNNKLGKFVGVWKGVYNNRNYEFRVVKMTKIHADLDFKEDLLEIKYKITEMNGDVVENTLDIIGDSYLLIKGLHFRDGAYYLYYQGRDSICGQAGDIYISVHQSNQNKMSFKLIPEGDIILEEDCPDGEATQVLPTEVMVLNKQ